MILNIANAKEDWTNADYCLASVTKDGETLQYVVTQTEEICNAAVNQAPTTIKYVKAKTKTQILTVLYQDGMLLRFIDDQSDPDIINAAINQNSFAIRYAKIQNEDLALSCVSQDGMLLVHVLNQTRKVCIAAFKQNRYSYKLVRDVNLRKELEKEFTLK